MLKYFIDFSINILKKSVHWKQKNMVKPFIVNYKAKYLPCHHEYPEKSVKVPYTEKEGKQGRYEYENAVFNKNDPPSVKKSKAYNPENVVHCTNTPTKQTRKKKNYSFPCNRHKITSFQKF